MNRKLKWDQFTGQRDAINKKYIAALGKTVACIILESILLVIIYKTSFFWIPLSAITITTVILIFQAGVVLLCSRKHTKIMEAFFKEFGKHTNQSFNIEKLSFREYVDYIETFDSASHLADLVNGFIQFDTRLSVVPANKRPEWELEWHKQANESLRESLKYLPLKSPLRRRVERALKSNTMLGHTKAGLLLEAGNRVEKIYSPKAKNPTTPALPVKKIEAAAPSPTSHKLPKNKIRVKPTVQAQVQEIKTVRHSIFDHAQKRVRWEDIEGFDISRIPTPYQEICSRILYFLCHRNASSTTFSQRAHDIQYINKFLAKYGNGQSLDTVNALNILVNIGLIKKTKDHHNQKRGVDYFKINLSPKAVADGYDVIRTKIIEEFASK